MAVRYTIAVPHFLGFLYGRKACLPLRLKFCLVKLCTEDIRWSSSTAIYLCGVVACTRSTCSRADTLAHLYSPNYEQIVIVALCTFRGLASAALYVLATSIYKLCQGVLLLILFLACRLALWYPSGCAEILRQEAVWATLTSTATAQWTLLLYTEPW